MKHTRFAWVVVFYIIGCDQSWDMVTNTRLDLWCGNVPCGWEAEGKVERVPTWHPRDWAVSLDSNDAAISQLNATANGSNTDCINFTLVAKISRSTRLFLELDFLDNGVIEVSQRLPESNWEERVFRINPPTWFQGVRFILRKESSGDAIIGRIEAQEYGTCNREPVELLNRPNGASCERDEQCEDGGCANGHCGRRCSGNEDCEPNEVCGLESRVSLQFVHNQGAYCGEPGRNRFGAPCIGDAECETGICCEGRCSTCCDNPICETVQPTPDAGNPETTCSRGNCEVGQQCGQTLWPRDTPPVEGLDDVLPWICAPGTSSGDSGDICTSSLDCESGTCLYAGVRCLDLLSCHFSSTNFESCLDLSSDLLTKQDTCRIEGGRCE